MNNTFEYKGVKIGFDINGKFTATVSGLIVRKPSLDAMKKHIDNAAKVKFAPFLALTDISHGDAPIKGLPGYTRVEVVGVIKSTMRYRSERSSFVVKRRILKGESYTGEATRTLYADTPENIALLRAESDKRKEKEAVVEKFDNEIREISKQQKRLNPDDYARSKS